MIYRLPLFLRVHPKERPRLNPKVGKMYSPKENQKEVLSVLSRSNKPDIDYPVIVDCYLYFRGGVGYPIATEYGDIDNLQKGILDAMVENKILRNDRLVIGGEVFKQFYSEDLVVILIWSVGDECYQLAV